jgi:hypothetical protein
MVRRSQARERGGEEEEEEEGECEESWRRVELLHTSMEIDLRMAEQRLEFMRREGELAKMRAEPSRFVMTEKELEIKVLVPPAVFGEQSLLHPGGGGGALASIIADTYVEVLAFSSTQQTRHWLVTEEMLTALRRRACAVPDDAEVERRFDEQATWGEYRGALLKQIPKKHWPVPKARVRDVGRGDSIIVPAGNTFGPRIVRMRH